MNVRQELDKQELEEMMLIPAVAINRAVLSIRSDMGTARLTFGEENVPGGPVYQRTAVVMSLPVLQGLYNLIGGTMQQMKAERQAAADGALSTTRN